ncbi:glycosyl hydrolase 108 family protein [Halomonas meridiana]|uniref:glycoside hydrolase family 108 protein n=1 Tax=Vreelandella aquamarina TaxID=77097 RepID=UPI00273B1E91|nr:glycosyl hydrolase 108 family protein [Halomonas meridiana]MDP4557984.1 glycosyl hydrolase 108 family protein [Halomonas meridiana]
MTTSLKQRLVASVIDREGGYVNHSCDRGGPTNYGITLVVARANGYYGDMREMPKSLAVKIYEARYWTSIRLDRIAPISATLAEHLFDFGVHSGPGRSAKELQRTLNVLNNRGKLFADLKEDGAVGPATLNALDAFRKARGGSGLYVLAESINGVRIAFCRGLAERDERQEDFAYGWFKRIVNLRSEVESDQADRLVATLYSEIAAEVA